MIDPHEEADLRSLFDATASEASGPVLTKLKARAGDIPSRARRPWWSRFALPAFALGAAGVAAVVLVVRVPDSTGPAADPTIVALQVPSRAVAPTASTPEVVPTEEAADDLAGLEALAWGDSDELWSGVSVEVEDNGDELLAALDSWMEEDG